MEGQRRDENTRPAFRCGRRPLFLARKRINMDAFSSEATSSRHAANRQTFLREVSNLPKCPIAKKRPSGDDPSCRHTRLARHLSATKSCTIMAELEPTARQWLVSAFAICKNQGVRKTSAVWDAIGASAPGRDPSVGRARPIPPAIWLAPASLRHATADVHNLWHRRQRGDQSLAGHRHRVAT